MMKRQVIADHLRHVILRVSEVLPSALPDWDVELKRRTRRGRPAGRYLIERQIQKELQVYFAGLQRRIIRNVNKP
jgi:hypothetical protein